MTCFLMRNDDISAMTSSHAIEHISFEKVSHSLFRTSAKRAIGLDAASHVSVMPRRQLRLLGYFCRAGPEVLRHYGDDT